MDSYRILRFKGQLLRRPLQLWPDIREHKSEKQEKESKERKTWPERLEKQVQSAKS